MIRPSAPVVLRLRQGDTTDFVGARRRDDYFGGKVAFEFRSKDQFDRAEVMVRKRLYPLCSSIQFQKLAIQMFGKANVHIDGGQVPGVALTRAQLEKLTDVDFVRRQIAKLKAATGDTPFLSAASIAEMAQFIATATDKNGRTLFGLVDKQLGPGIDKAIRNGRLEVREAVDLFQTRIAQKREHLPAIMVGEIDGKTRTFGARDSWHFDAHRRFEFSSTAQYDAFQKELAEKIVPLFSSPEFAKLVGKLIGTRALSETGVQIGWVDFHKLRVTADVEAALRATGAKPIAGVDDPAEAARQIVAITNYIIDTDIAISDSVFGVLSSVDGQPTISTRDVRQLLRGTALASASLPQ